MRRDALDAETKDKAVSQLEEAFTRWITDKLRDASELISNISQGSVYECRRQAIDAQVVKPYAGGQMGNIDRYITTPTPKRTGPYDTFTGYATERKKTIIAETHKAVCERIQLENELINYPGKTSPEAALKEADKLKILLDRGDKDARPIYPRGVAEAIVNAFFCRR